MNFGNTTIWWIFYTYFLYVVLGLAFKYINFKLIKKNETTSIVFLIVWFLVCFIRGIFVADNYWQWKNLMHVGFTFLIPSISFLSLNPRFFSVAIRQWILYALPFFIVVYFCLTPESDGSGRYLAPVSILTLFISVVNRKYKLILISLSAFVILDNFDARSNIIKFIIPFGLGLLSYFKFFENNRLLKIIFITSIVAPFFFLFLGVTQQFNVFKFEEYLYGGQAKIVKQNGKEISLTVDTRTFLYNEVISSAIKYDYVFLGRTPARGNDSESFGLENYKLGINNIERFANEVAILNIFTWTGMVGVLLYFWTFAKAAFLAIYKSRNQYAKLLGIYLCFRWCYNWVEDFTIFDLFFISLWMIIGLCYSKKFRLMSNYEVEVWIKKIIYFK